MTLLSRAAAVSARARAAGAGVVVVAIALVAPAGCSDDGPGEGEARFEVDGEAIVERDGERSTIDGSTDLHPGDRVEVAEGVGLLQLRDGVRMELRAGLEDADRSVLVMGAVPKLEAGDVLVSAPEDVVVEAAGTLVTVHEGAAQVSRRLGVGVAAYDAAVTIDSAGQEREVPALRQMQVPALGRPPRAPRPLAYDEQDPWDRRYLGSAIELGRRLEAMADGYTANLAADQVRDPGFLVSVLPTLSDEAELAALVVPERPTGETLIGAAITDLGSKGSFTDRWDQVFGFRDAGAEWGLVALDQQVSADPLLGTVEQAITASPLTFVDVVTPVAPPTTSGTPRPGSTTPTPSPTTGTPPPPPPAPSTTRPPGTSAPPPPTSAPPPTTPPQLVPSLEPVLEPVTDLVGGLLGGLLNP